MGIYRLLLAYCVVIEHLSGNQYLTHTGMFAVFGFYVLSGYLITRVLNDIYEFKADLFWANRFLRLFPPYGIFLIIGLLFIFGTTSAAEFFPAVWKADPTLADWIGVLTVFPMGVSPMEWRFRPVPSIWSVGVELLNYALLYAFVARSRHIALLVALGAAIYHGVGLWRGDNLGLRYFPFYAALLPFALGSLIYFYTRASRRISPRGALMLCMPAAVTCLVAGVLGGVQQTWLFETLFYLNLAFQCLAVWALSVMTPGPYRTTDKWIGDLSYPVFLCHWQVGYVLSVLFFPDRSLGLALMFATLVGSTGVACVTSQFQEMIVEPLRSRIRSKGVSTSHAPNRGIART